MAGSGLNNLVSSCTLLNRQEWKEILFLFDDDRLVAAFSEAAHTIG